MWAIPKELRVFPIAVFFSRDSATNRTTPNCAFQNYWLSLSSSIVLPREKTK
jgi:hypothetical protein